MRKPFINLQELRRKIYRKAKAEIRRFAMKQKGRPGCGWKRWSNEQIYKEWGLANNYGVQYFYRSPVKVSPSKLGR